MACEDCFINAKDARAIADSCSDNAVRIRKLIFSEIKKCAEEGKYSCDVFIYDHCSECDAVGFMEFLKSFAYEASYSIYPKGCVAIHVSWR